MYIAIVFNNMFTVRKEGGLTKEEFKQGARIKSINPTAYRALLIETWEASGYTYLPEIDWEIYITPSKQQDIGDERYITLKEREDFYPDPRVRRRTA